MSSAWIHAASQGKRRRRTRSIRRHVLNGRVLKDGEARAQGGVLSPVESAVGCLDSVALLLLRLRWRMVAADPERGERPADNGLGLPWSAASPMDGGWRRCAGDPSRRCESVCTPVV